MDPAELSPDSRLSPAGDHVLLEHHVRADADFARAARDLFALLLGAQRRHPALPRWLRITIEGHTGERAGYDEDMFELQQEFLLGAMGRFFTRIDTPLTGSLGNPEPQQDTPADRLRIDDPASG